MGKIVLVIILISSLLYAKSVPFSPKIFTLKNGLKVVLYANKSTSTVSCRMVYKVGAKVEESGYTGISHMLEHMMFKGTKKVGTTNFKKDYLLWQKIDTAFESLKIAKNSKDSINIKNLQKRYDSLVNEANKIAIKNHYWKLLDAQGGSGVNAYTTKDATVYTTALPSNKLELYFAVESDRMANAFFREFYSERDVVREERRMRYETRPWGMAYEALFANAYNNHPYRNPVIGWASDIMAYTRDYLKQYHKKYYAPNNAVLIVVGDIDYKKTEKMIKKYFEKIPSSKIEKRHITKEVQHTAYKKVKIEYNTQPFAMMSFNIYDNSMKTAAVYDVIQIILSEGRSSILYKNFIQTRKALSLDGYNYTLVDPGLFIFNIKPAPNYSIDSLENELYTVFDSLKNGNFGDWEIQKAKNNLKTYYYGKFESNNGIASIIGDYELFGGLDKLEEYLNWIDKVDKDMVKEYSKKIFVKTNETFVEVLK